jgi:hypothetical protein
LGAGLFAAGLFLAAVFLGVVARALFFIFMGRTLQQGPGGGQVGASPQNLGYRRQARKSEVTVTQIPEEVPVTRASLRDYAARQRDRYAEATTRPQKRAILNEVVAVARIPRKAAIRLLRRAARAGGGARRPGRPRHYGPRVRDEGGLVS